MHKYPVRTSAKAVIIKDNHLLTIKMRSKVHDYFILPGGGQNGNETLKSALKRECLEEVGAEVEIKDIIFIREYIADNHEFADQNPGFHQVEFFFDCLILNAGKFKSQTEPDTNQIGMEWLPVEKLDDIPLYPKILRKEILSFIKNEKRNVYLGDVN